MTAHFRISAQDYLDASRLFAKPTVRAWWIMACVVALLILAIAFGTKNVQGFGIGGLIGGLGMYALLRWVVSPLSVRRSYRKYKPIHQEFTVSLLDTGVHSSSPTGENLLVWEHIMKWRHNDQFVLLYASPRLYHIVPKAVAEQGFDIDLLLQQLGDRVGPPT